MWAKSPWKSFLGTVSLEMVSLGNLLGNKVLGYILLVTSFLGNGLLGTAFLESATVPLGTAGVN